FFSDRDGIKKNTLAEIGYNRRSGYTWYTDKSEKVLESYPVWAMKYVIKN
ncbi:MAG: pectate lyase, partial [Ignavibacteria bacterium]|nr:pectate lyase [Ignavibacteria bacterium]